MSIVKDLIPKMKIDKKKLVKVYNDIIRINNEALFSSYPDKRIVIHQKLIDDMVSSTGLSEQQIAMAIDRSPTIDASFAFGGNVANIALSLMIIATHKTDIKFCKQVQVVMGMKFYSFFHYKYFEHLPDAAVMKATINSMQDNNDIRKYKTVYGFIEHKALSNHANMVGIDYKTNKKKGPDRLDRGSDKDVLEYISGLYSRLNDSMKTSIRGNFAKAHAAGEYYNDVADADLPDWIDDRNLSQAIVSLATKTSMSIQRRVDPRMVRQASTLTKVSYHTMTVVITKIAKNENDHIFNACLDISGLFLSNPKNKTQMVKSRYFVDKCEEIYKKNNTADERIIDLKERLDAMLDNNYDEYKHLTREATRSNYKKALYMFLVIAISNYG
jgi:hypothetical protein